MVAGPAVAAVRDEATDQNFETFSYQGNRKTV